MTLTQANRDQLACEVREMVDAYREDVANHVRTGKESENDLICAMASALFNSWGNDNNKAHWTFLTVMLIKELADSCPGENTPS